MSLFDLNTTGELPPSNQGISQYRFDRITPTRNAVQAQFPNGSIEFRWSMAGNRWWVPARSYVRMRIRIGGNAYAQLTGQKTLAPAMNMVASLFINGQIYVEDQELDNIPSFMAEIDTLKKRLTKSGDWLNGVGHATNLFKADFLDRANKITTGLVGGKTWTKAELAFPQASTIATNDQDPATVTFVTPPAANTDFTIADIFRVGDIIMLPDNREVVVTAIATALTLTATFITGEAGDLGATANDWALRRGEDLGANYLELIWRPPFSVMDLDKALPVGNYRMNLNPAPNPTYKTRSMESVGARTVVTNYDVQIDEMLFFVASMAGPRVKNMTYYLDLDHIQCASQDKTAAQDELQFTVSPKTYAISVAFYDTGAGSDSRYPITRFVNRNEDELDVTVLQVQYAGQNKPPVQADPRYVQGTGDYLVQRYNDTQLYSGMFFDSAGPESYPDWRERGPIYFLPFPKDADDESTRVILRSTITGAANLRALLFAHYKKMAIVQIADGRVQDVRLLER